MEKFLIDDLSVHFEIITTKNEKKFSRVGFY